MNRKSFLASIVASIAALFGLKVKALAHIPASTYRIKEIHPLKDIKFTTDLWTQIKAASKNCLVRIDPAKDGFNSLEELEAAEYCLFVQLCNRGWWVHIETKAYLCSGLAWKTFHDPVTDKYFRNVTPEFVGDIIEQHNILYRMLKGMEEISRNCSDRPITLPPGVMPDTKWLIS